MEQEAIQLLFRFYLFIVLVFVIVINGFLIITGSYDFDVPEKVQTNKERWISIIDTISFLNAAIILFPFTSIVLLWKGIIHLYKTRNNLIDPICHDDFKTKWGAKKN